MVPVSLESTLLGLEHRFWEAATDPGFYRENLADDAFMALPYGVGVLDKTAVLSAIAANPERWTSHAVSDVRVAELGDEVALICYRVEATRSGDPVSYRALVASVYVRRAGAWRLAFHQQTPESSPAAG